MPVIDLPLSELQRYAGRNPRPADFDAYWDGSVLEMESLGTDADLIPQPAVQSQIAEAFDLWFTGVGGARVHAKYLRPRTPGRHPAVVQFHGYGSNSGDWTDKLNLVSEGYCVAAMDCRGQGGLSEDGHGVHGFTLRGHMVRGLDEADPRRLFFRSIFLDTAQLAGIVMARPEVDPRRVAATGASQGGALTLACAALEPRLKLAAPLYPFLCDYQRVWEMDLAKDAYDELRAYFRACDPEHLRQDDVFRKLGYIDCQHLAPRIRAEVLMFTGLMDTICPPSTQFAAYNKIRAPKNMILFPDFAHEYLPGCGDHLFRFLKKL
jgi:cephalosporin-C deacetylase